MKRRSRLKQRAADCPSCARSGLTLCRHGSTLRRKQPPRTRTALPKRNPARRDREWARAYGSEDRVAWVQRQPSVVSGKRPCVNAHVRTGGTGRKADARWIVPLTWEEHEDLHRVGVATFQREHGVDLEAEARRVDAEWRGR
ncbi:MAG TPA: hypothetical protein VK966_00945 [Longimicrobiales bacterium]|nr:hypothetical protein [Longimicrobiales bacterium]